MEREAAIAIFWPYVESLELEDCMFATQSEAREFCDAMQIVFNKDWRPEEITAAIHMDHPAWPVHALGRWHCIPATGALAGGVAD